MVDPISFLSLLSEGIVQKFSSPSVDWSRSGPGIPTAKGGDINYRNMLAKQQDRPRVAGGSALSKQKKNYSREHMKRVLQAFSRIGIRLIKKPDHAYAIEYGALRIPYLTATELPPVLSEIYAIYSTYLEELAVVKKELNSSKRAKLLQDAKSHLEQFLGAYFKDYQKTHSAS